MNKTAKATKPLTEEEIKAFAIAWYDALDIHAPVEECYKVHVTLTKAYVTSAAWPLPTGVCIPARLTSCTYLHKGSN